ncbi:MAG: prepilin-type N-terminal cleavage/methylation domain-containing protein [Deltaproteobacteria bacterium]|nr:prepilin-type N-terminal cleavage/methylation domain-containing protein [Deltaproteobacteria bacterium]
MMNIIADCGLRIADCEEKPLRPQSSVPGLSGVGFSRRPQFSRAFRIPSSSRSSCPRRRASRRRAPWIAGVLDSRLRGNDDFAFLSGKNPPLKAVPGPPPSYFCLLPFAFCLLILSQWRPKAQSARLFSYSPSPQPLAPSAAGFTLLEVLVASALLSMVLAIVYGVFSQTLTSTRRAEEHSAQSRAARIVLLRIGDDLQASFSFAPGHPRFVGNTSRGQQFPDAFLSFVSLSGLPLTSGSHAGDGYEIEYALVPDPRIASARQLVRRARFAPTTVDSSTNRASEGETLPLLTGVWGWRLRFFDGRVWHDEWGTEHTSTKLPRAVEVELYLVRKSTDARHEEEDTVRFSTLVDLPLAETRRGGS